MTGLASKQTRHAVNSVRVWMSTGAAMAAHNAQKGRHLQRACPHNDGPQAEAASAARGGGTVRMSGWTVRRCHCFVFGTARVSRVSKSTRNSWLDSDLGIVVDGRRDDPVMLVGRVFKFRLARNNTLPRDSSRARAGQCGTPGWRSRGKAGGAVPGSTTTSKPGSSPEPNPTRTWHGWPPRPVMCRPRIATPSGATSRPPFLHRRCRQERPVGT